MSSHGLYVVEHSGTDDTGISLVKVFWSSLFTPSGCHPFGLSSSLIRIQRVQCVHRHFSPQLVFSSSCASASLNLFVFAGPIVRHRVLSIRRPSFPQVVSAICLIHSLSLFFAACGFSLPHISSSTHLFPFKSSSLYSLSLSDTSNSYPSCPSDVRSACTLSLSTSPPIVPLHP